MKVVETKGVPHTLTQTDLKTFRILARETKVIEDYLVSDEFRAEEKLGSLLLLPDDIVIKKATTKKKED